MMKSIEALNTCISPLSTARVLNPTRSEYYLKDVQPVAKLPEASVRITLSAEAQAALKSA